MCPNREFSFLPDSSCLFLFPSLVDIYFQADQFTAAFKRFYHGHCHLQLLFTQQGSVQLDASTFSPPWLKPLWAGLNATLARPPSSTEAVRQLLADKQGRSSSAQPWEVKDVLMWDIKIKAASTVALALHQGAAMALVVGDAAITAHFR